MKNNTFNDAINERLGVLELFFPIYKPESGNYKVVVPYTGDGYDAIAVGKLLSKYDKVYILAVDKNIEHLKKYAKENIKRSGIENIYLLCTPFEELKGEFDLNFSYCCRAQDTKKFFDASYQTLRKEGHLIFVRELGDYEDWKPENKYQRNLQKWYKKVVMSLFPRANIFERSELSKNYVCELLKSAGFTILSSNTITHRGELADSDFEKARGYLKECKSNANISEIERMVGELEKNRKVENKYFAVISQK